jgi:hypothetical protein
MRSFVIIFAIAVAVAVAEPPRRRANFRSFARQEEVENGEAADGYKYEAPPKFLRLRLPNKPNQFARNEAQPSNGYHYPKPTYGLPDMTTTQEPNVEYGPPEGEDTTDEPESTDQPEATTTDPQVENLRRVKAAQLRRKNGKFAAQKLVQPQPVFLVQYPVADLVNSQYVYVWK